MKNETRSRKWSLEWVCVVCGKDVPKGIGRRKHCSGTCQTEDSRRNRATTPRPSTATCQQCDQEFSLARRDLDGRLQRTDTKWCRACGRTSPEVIRFKRYGITEDQYQAALQLGCGICGRTDQKLHVDHDHSCCSVGKKTCGLCVRGFLCGPCNRAIGMFNDDVDVLKKAIRYLEREA